MALYPAFEKLICEKWGFVTAEPRSHAELRDGLAAKRQRVAVHHIKHMPTAHGERAPETTSESVPGRFSIIVDCLPLAAVVNGQTSLANPSLEPVFGRITRNLFAMLDRGWKPSRDIDDAIVWQPREFNKMADFLVNYTMDERKSWAKVFPERADVSPEANFLVHADGGTREGRCSAAAWCIEAVHVRGQTQARSVVLIAGTFISDPVSSFLAETIALDEAVQALDTLLSFRVRPSH